jgi:RNA polymerase-binding protein DksA
MTIASAPSKLGRIKAKLQEDLNKLKAANQRGMVVEQRDREVHSPVEDASMDIEKETALQEFTVKIRKIVQIEEALKMLENGTYGKCKDCGEPISLARLEAVPETTLCLSCCSSKKNKCRK